MMNLSYAENVPKVVLSGYYGFNNLGDELILHVLIEQLKQRNLQIVVLSNNPRQTRTQYQVEAIHRTQIVDIIKTMASADLFISGGGGLFQDITGPLSVVYYGGLVQLAKFFEVPICFWGQGIGPLKRKFSQWWTNNVLKACNLITVRDLASAAYAENATGRNPVLAADPVWLLEMQLRYPPVAYSTNRRLPPRDQPWTIGISLRDWPALTDERLLQLAIFLKEFTAFADQPVRYLLLPFQPNEDRKILKKLAKMLMQLQSGYSEIVPENEVINRVPTCDVLFGMRFHSLVLGILSNVAVYGLVYDNKVRHLIEMFNLQGTAIEHLEEISSPTEIQGIQHFLEHYPPIDLENIRQQAYLNFTALDHLLDEIKQAARN